MQGTAQAGWRRNLYLFVKRTLLDDMNSCAKILIGAQYEDVTIGDRTFMAAVSDETSDATFAGDGGLAAGTALRVMVAEREDMRSMIGQPAIVRGTVYYVSACSYSGADNEFQLIATSDS